MVSSSSSPSMDPMQQIKSKDEEQRKDKKWSPNSWRDFEPKQMPVYSDLNRLKSVTDELSKSPPLVLPSEVQRLQSQLSKACAGEAFLLMGGDCAESFKEFSVNKVRDTYRVLMQMALVMTYGSGLPVVKVGRMAGQFAKPRSEPNEEKDGLSLPSYRGDIVNEELFTPEARENNPFKMVQAYRQSAQTMNLLRAFTTGGYADIKFLHSYNLEFASKNTEEGSQYRKLCSKIEESIRFMQTLNVAGPKSPIATTTSFFTAHECLLLEYEQAFTRKDPELGKWYDQSAHMLWVGECTPEELVQIVKTMNPDNIPGKLTVVVRMGADNI